MVTRLKSILVCMVLIGFASQVGKIYSRILRSDEKNLMEESQGPEAREAFYDENILLTDQKKERKNFLSNIIENVGKKDSLASIVKKYQEKAKKIYEVQKKILGTA